MLIYQFSKMERLDAWYFHRHFEVRVQGSWLQRQVSFSLERCRRKGGAGCTSRRIVLDPEAELHPASCISRRIRSALACCHFLSIPFFHPGRLPSPLLPILFLSPSLLPSFSFLPFSLVLFTLALAGSVIPILDLYNTVSAARVSHCLAWTRTIPFHRIVSFSFRCFPSCGIFRVVDALLCFDCFRIIRVVELCSKFICRVVEIYRNLENGRRKYLEQFRTNKILSVKFRPCSTAFCFFSIKNITKRRYYY